MIKSHVMQSNQHKEGYGANVKEVWEEVRATIQAKP
jgi:hypothetical protein